MLQNIYKEITRQIYMNRGVNLYFPKKQKNHASLENLYQTTWYGFIFYVFKNISKILVNRQSMEGQKCTKFQDI